MAIEARGSAVGSTHLRLSGSDTVCACSCAWTASTPRAANIKMATTVWRPRYMVTPPVHEVELRWRRSKSKGRARCALVEFQRLRERRKQDELAVKGRRRSDSRLISPSCPSKLSWRLETMNAPADTAGGRRANATRPETAWRDCTSPPDIRHVTLPGRPSAAPGTCRATASFPASLACTPCADGDRLDWTCSMAQRLPDRRA